MKTFAPYTGISMNDTAALQAFYSSVIPKPTKAMPSVERLISEAKQAEQKLLKTGVDPVEFENATLRFRQAKYTRNRASIRSANFYFRRDGEWKLIAIEKCMASSEIWDRNRIDHPNPEIQEKLGAWNF